MNAENVVEAEIEPAKETTVIVLGIGKGTENDDVTETERAKGATVALETDQTADTLIEIASATRKGTEMTAGAKGMTLTVPIATMTRGPNEKGTYSTLQMNYLVSAY